MNAAETCELCHVVCNEGDEALGCDLCLKWFHRTCLDYNVSTYKAIIKLDEVKWFCPSCNGKSKDTLSLIQSVMKRMDGLEQKNLEVEKKNAVLEKRVLALENEKGKDQKRIENLENDKDNHAHDGSDDEKRRIETLEKEVSKIKTNPMQRVVKDDNIDEVVKKDLNTLVSKELMEWKDQEDRKNNFLISNMPLLDTKNPEERQRLRQMGLRDGEDYGDLVEKMFGIIGIEEEIQIQEIVYLNDPREEKAKEGEEKPKSMIVKLEQNRLQKLVLKNAWKLKDLPGWSSSFMSPDLTKSQREAAYKLRQEKRRRIAAGEENLIIRDGAVVERKIFREDK